MPDREKVIKGIQECNLNGGLIGNCPYKGILALLKEQEAVEPEVEVMNEIDRLYKCPKCQKCFFYEKQKYCDRCGQAVKWDA